MTSPRVIELPRRLEPVSRDTFLGVPDHDVPRPVTYVGNVVPLRPRGALTPDTPTAPRAA